jgi:hypothetical protein
MIGNDRSGGCKPLNFSEPQEAEAAEPVFRPNNEREKRNINAGYEPNKRYPTIMINSGINCQLKKWR